MIDNLLEAPSIVDEEKQQQHTTVWSDGEEDDETTTSHQSKINIDLDSISSSELISVMESDASQDAVIVAAQQNECTVVRGPPGTGKSQVIVNLIANALAKERRVLVVCQKRAALDVVYQRMHKVGLEDLLPSYMIQLLIGQSSIDTLVHV